MEAVLCKTKADQFGDLLLCFTLFLGQRYRANIETQGGGSRTLVEGEVMHTHTIHSIYSHNSFAATCIIFSITFHQRLAF